MSDKTSCCCILCKKEITQINLIKHYNSIMCQTGKKATSFVKLTQCKYCTLDFSKLSTSYRANHSRWCDKNPKVTEYREKMKQTLILTKVCRTPEQLRKQVADAHKRGVYKNATAKGIITKIKNGTNKHSDISKERCRQAALKSNHQRVCKRTHSFTDKRGRTFMFDSSWEDLTAIRLDELNIEWIRPEPIKYQTADNKTHHYFPDFYLPNYDIYLDPKNSYAESKQKEKIDIISGMVTLKILRSPDECKAFLI